MANLGVVFLTGLTSGGLSCLAVQGGLLASSVAAQAEDDLLGNIGTKKGDHERGAQYLFELQELNDQKSSNKHYKKALVKLRHKYPKLEVEAQADAPKKHIAQPITLFLGAKLVAYTILGGLLGALGSVLQLTPYMRAGLQIAIGIFMLGTALRMLNVHPIFRYFSIEPPKSVTRYIRRKAKNSKGQFVTPLFLGALTVLIPCGVTTAIMALAVGSGSPVAGALIMAAFVIGTSPVFFGLFYFATKLGEKLEAKFLKLAGAVILFLALLSIEGGLNLAGSSISFAALQQSLAAKGPSQEQTQAQSATSPTSSQATRSGQSADTDTINMGASYQAYSPAVMQAKAGQPYKLVINSQQNTGCGRAFVIPSLGMQQTLPVDGETTISLPAQKPGTMRLTCAMGMYHAQIQFN